MTALSQNTDYPTPDASHLHSEIGYASLPPPPLRAEQPLHSEPPSSQNDSLSVRFPSPRDGLPFGGTSRDGATLSERFAPHWIDLLRQAVEEPGLIAEAYTRFHNYSLGNRLAALLQCRMRSIEPGPIHTFNGWRKLGYGVCEGEKALTLCMPLKGVLAREKQPVSGSAAQANTASQAYSTRPALSSRPDIEEIEYVRAFVWKPHWFVLAQTQPHDPDLVQPLPVPTFNEWCGEAALAGLHIHLIPFTALDGNVQGLARGRGIAVSPIAAFPQKTFFHEMAHVVLGHTEPDRMDGGEGAGSESAGLEDSAELSRSEREAEAEGVALLLLDAFDLPGQDQARGYIQHCLGGEELTEKSAQRIFGAADRILSAGLGEGRMRHPTAEELGWPQNGVLLSTAAAPSATAPVAEFVNGTESLGEPAALGETSSLAAFAFNGAGRSAVLSDGNGAGEYSALPSFALSRATLQVSTPTSGISANGDAAPSEITSEPALRTPTAFQETADSSVTVSGVTNGGAAHAWKLHGRLTLLHDELHPETPEESAGIARGLRHLASLDPLGALALRDLVKSASRSLKAACHHLEATLESEAKLGGDEASDGVDVFGEENEPSAEAPSETPNGAGQNGGADSGEVSAIASNQTPQAELAALSANVLSAKRAESARRSIGRQWRDELGAEKRRFLEAAKEHGLKVGGRHEKAMLGALSEFLGCAVVSRRTPSLHQWMRAASALETEDLRW